MKFLRNLYNKLFKKPETIIAVHKFPIPEEAPVVVPTPEIQLNLDTGKIILPDNMSPEDRAEVESALAELQQSLQSFTKDQFQSFEDYLTSPKTGTATVIPFISAKNLPDDLSQVKEEMEDHGEDTEHWSTDDFIETLLGFHNAGYEFSGFEEMFNRASQQELTDEDRKRLEQWYMLVSMELVYDV